MAGLVPIAKNADPDRLVLFRSHIQIQADLVAKGQSAASDIWDYLWQSGIGQADVFISHPVRDFVQGDVPNEKVT